MKEKKTKNLKIYFIKKMKVHYFQAMIIIKYLHFSQTINNEKDSK